MQDQDPLCHTQGYWHAWRSHLEQRSSLRARALGQAAERRASAVAVRAQHAFAFWRAWAALLGAERRGGSCAIVTTATGPAGYDAWQQRHRHALERRRLAVELHGRLRRLNVLGGRLSLPLGRSCRLLEPG